VNKIGITLSLAAAIGVGTTFISTAQAAPAGMSGQLGVAANSINLIEQTQFFFGEKEYCWYDDGWHGPGWYWCGYALRQGFGWGGPVGWRNWDRHHPPRGPRPIGHGPVVRGPVVHGPGSSHNPRPGPRGPAKCFKCIKR
jgi:hypothetical protein